MPLMTASAEADLLYASGKGSMFLSISGIHKGREAIIRLYPVYYVAGLSHRYLSVGSLPSQGLELVSDKSFLEFRTPKAYWPVFWCTLHSLGQSVYWLSVKISSAHSLLAKSVIMNVDYEIMHRQFAHPSMDVLRHASGHSQGFHSIIMPKEALICPGCALGKMTCSSFPAMDKCAAKPSDKVHMDLKAMPSQYYHGYTYFLIIFDEYTSHGDEIAPSLASEIAKSHNSSQLRDYMNDYDR